jgi:hypothetical protein
MVKLPGIFKAAIAVQIQRLLYQGGGFVPRRNRLTHHAESTAEKLLESDR